MHAQPLRFDRTTDGAVLAAAGLAWLGGEWMQPVIVQPSCQPCRAGGLNLLDRPFAGRHDSAADAISWGLAGALLALPPIVEGIEVSRSHQGSWRDDLGFYLEALAIDGAINQLVKLAVQRPRPFVYGETVVYSSENYVSFYSEHTSLAFTAAASYTTLFALRHPGERRTIAGVAMALFAAASATAVLRVAAGKHFPTDVLVGALAGTVVGAAVPLVHRRSVSPGIAVVPVEGGAMALVQLTN